jgi:hypothetical protein
MELSTLRIINELGSFRSEVLKEACSGCKRSKKIADLFWNQLTAVAPFY